MWLGGAYIATMGGRDKDRAARVSSLANEEPLVVVEAGVDIVREVVGKDCGDSRGSMVGKGKTPLRRGGCWGIYEGTFGTEDGDIGRDRGIDAHRRSEVFAAWGGYKDIVGVDSDVFVERGKKEGVKNLLSDLGRGGRHGEWRYNN